MDDKKKIVLGSEDIIAKGLDDIFINVNLQQSFNQIKKDKYDNNFDLSEQFRKERNLSRSFRIYGILDSNIIDTDNFTMEIYKDSGLTQFYTAITTSSLVYEESNVFNKKRGKYLLNLDNYDSDYVYMKITGDYVTYDDQVFEQQLVFYTVDGKFVEYGTQTVDIGLVNQGFITINNDFPFFYNKHWIKKDIEIIESKQAIVNFKTADSNTNEGDSTQITIELDKPSPFGNEIFDLSQKLITAKLTDFNISISGNPVNLPTTLTWNKGEQYKTFDFDGLNDDFPEFSESVLFEISNFQFVDSGLTTTHTANIHDSTPRRYTNYHFGDMYRNRYNFTGRSWHNSNYSNIKTNSFSILRNGLYYERRNEEFYPNDTYSLKIVNKGNDTVIPINANLGISQEEMFLSGEARIFPLKVNYNGTQVQKIKVIFSGSGGNSQNSNGGYININGIPFYLNNRINYNSAKAAFTTYNPLTSRSLEVPWSFDFNDTEKIITITSNSPGIPVDFSTVETRGPGTSNPIDQTKIPIIEEVDNFVFYEQIPLEIQLAANSYGNAQCYYEFFLDKPGFSTLHIPVIPFPTAAPPSIKNAFLIVRVDSVMRDWDNNTQNCTFITGTTVAAANANAFTYWPVNTTTPNPANFIMPIGSAYINGSVLYSNNTLPGHQINESTYLSAAFYVKKLQVESCTNNPISPISTSQITKLTLPGISSGNITAQQLLQANANSYRSFDFRTGTTGTFTTLSKTNNNFTAFQDWNWNSFVMVSNGTYGGTNSNMSNILDYGNSPLTIPGPIEGQDAIGNHLSINAHNKIIYLKSKTPGVPFEITNIINAYVHTSYSYGNQQVAAGTILGPITTESIVSNITAGLDPNPANNHLGGFNPVLQYIP